MIISIIGVILMAGVILMTGAFVGVYLVCKLIYHIDRHLENKISKG